MKDTTKRDLFRPYWFGESKLRLVFYLGLVVLLFYAAVVAGIALGEMWAELR